MVLENLEGNFDVIRGQLTDALEHLGFVCAEMARLKRAGMYAAVPTVTWKDEGGRHKYMQLLFPVNSEGGYDSPNGKRKYYVGCKKSRVASAEIMIERRRRYEGLEQAAKRLEIFISSRAFDLDQLATRCGRWMPAPQGFLGTDPAELVCGVPKVEEAT